MHHRRNVERLRKHLKIMGRVYTPEREELLRVIASMKGIYTLEELFQKAHKRKALHAKSTIYRCIDIFLESSFIKEAERPGARKIYKTNHRVFSKKQGA